MALTLEQLQAQRDEIIAEMSRPAHMQFADRSLTRRPQPELEATLKRVDLEIARLQSPQPTIFTIVSKRGI